MGQKADRNFQKRFGNPPRITITPVPLSPPEKRFHNEKIFEVYKQVLTSLLKRPPTEKELFGLVNIEKVAKAATNPSSKNLCLSQAAPVVQYFAHAKLEVGDMANSNPLKKWRTVAQVAEQCGVSPQAIRDAIKAKKIEACPVGEYILIHKDQIPLFEKTRKREFRQVSEGRYRVGYLPARGRRKVSTGSNAKGVEESAVEG